MLQAKVRVTKKVFESGSYNIYGAIPLEISEGEIELNSYGNITLKTQDVSLVVSHEYNMTLQAQPSKYGLTYFVVSTGFDFADVKEITPELNLALLKEIMSEKLAEEIHKHYPNFVALVLEKKQDQIDIKKIKGVGKVLFAKYVKKINARCISFMLRASYPRFELNEQDAKNLISRFDNINIIKERLDENPYYTLIAVCGWNFLRVDKIAKEDFRFAQCRGEYLIDFFIRKQEDIGSTYCLASELADDVWDYDKEIVPLLKGICEESNILYYDEPSDILQRISTHNEEMFVADSIQERIITPLRPLPWEWNKFINIPNGKLTEEQQNVLKQFCEHNFLILDAPAGTGKSATVKAVLDMLDEYNNSYICLAPTGKAAVRLKEQTGREAYTIHMAVLSFINLDYDVVIVDEVSMLSLSLTAMLFSAIKNPQTRILFIGDSAQIPAIGTGRILKDMLESGVAPHCTLTHCFRFKQGGASYVSALSRQGEQYITDEKSLDTLNASKDYRFIFWEEDRGLSQVIAQYLGLMKKYGAKPEDICVLVPYNKYDFGAVTINNTIQSYVNPVSIYEDVVKIRVNNTPVTFHEGDLVMNIKNNYHAPLYEDEEKAISIFNGQVGKIVKIESYNEEFRSAIAVVRINGENIVFTRFDFNHLRLGYASTIHKYQGSQAKYVINIIIPQHEYMWNKQLLYTAQTRMEKKLIEIGSISTINGALRKTETEKRKTLLKKLLTSGSK